jgi:TIR domain
VKYDAFISDSHSVDGRLAPALQNGLQRLARPWYRRRALRVFRDDTGLSVNPHLWGSIQDGLDESRYFVLLASPEAAASPWVNREIEHWLATRPSDTLLPILTDGTLVWDAQRGDFDPDQSSALPPALRDFYADEPATSTCAGPAKKTSSTCAIPVSAPRLPNWPHRSMASPAKTSKAKTSACTDTRSAWHGRPAWRWWFSRPRRSSPRASRSLTPRPPASNATTQSSSVHARAGTRPAPTPKKPSPKKRDRSPEERDGGSEERGRGPTPAGTCRAKRECSSHQLRDAA